MTRIFEVIVVLLTAVVMIILTVIVGLVPMAITQLNGLADLDFLARIIGCLIAIPMLKLTFTAIDWVSDLKYWRD